MALIPQFIHQVNPKLKHIYLTFDEEGCLIVRSSPKVSQLEIESLLIRKSEWIRKSQQRTLAKKGRSSKIDGENPLYYLGTSYPVTLRHTPSSPTTLTFDGEHFVINYRVYDPEHFALHLDHFYKEEAKRVILPMVQQWSQKMACSPTGVTFRKTKCQWGSCSAKNRLSLNTMLCKLPIECIEYVVVHELAHITHKHHQKAFWALVETYLPDYKTRIAQLKSYTTI